MTHRLVVLGAGYAGLGAARRAARRLRRTDVEVTLINATDRFVERIRLHQLAAGQALRDRPLRTMLDGADVKLIVARVTAIDVDSRVVRLDAEPYTVGYDTVVYALGSGADVGSVPGYGSTRSRSRRRLRRSGYGRICSVPRPAMSLPSSAVA